MYYVESQDRRKGALGLSYWNPLRTRPYLARTRRRLHGLLLMSGLTAPECSWIIPPGPPLLAVSPGRVIEAAGGSSEPQTLNPLHPGMRVSA